VFTYTPKAGFVGTDTFTYKAYDGKDYSEVKEVRIEVKSITLNTSDTVAPSKATILSINSPSSNKITLFWLGSTDDKTNAADLSYEVHCSTQKDFVPDGSTKKLTVKGALEADVVDLDEETLYYVKIKTVDAGGNEALSSEMNITTATASTVVLNTANSVKKADDLFLHDAVTTDTSITYPKTDKTVLPNAGDILVGDAESRTLRKIMSVSTSNGKVQLTTEPATMSEVFDDLKLETKTVLYDPSQITTSGNSKISYKRFKSYSYAKAPQKGYTWDSGRFKIEQPSSSISPSGTKTLNTYNKQISHTGSYVKISSPSDEEIKVVSGEALNIQMLAELNEGSDSGFDNDDSSKLIESFELVSVTHEGEIDGNNFGFSMSSKMGYYGARTGSITFIASDKRASTEPYILTVKAKAKWYDETGIDTWEESEEEVQIKVTVLTKDLESSEGFTLSLEDDAEYTKYSFPIFPDFTLKYKIKHDREVKATAGVDIDFTPTMVTKLDIDKKYVKVLLGGKMTFTLDSSFNISGDLSKTYDFNLTALDKKFINLYAAGPIPVYQEIDVKWQMEVTPSTSGSIDVSNHMEKVFNVNFGLECTGTSCKNLSSTNERSEYTAAVKVGAEASLEVRLVPKVTVSFYRAASATLAVEPWVKAGVAAEGEASFASNYSDYDAWLSYELKDLSASAGLDGYINADFSIMGWELFKYPDEGREKLFGVNVDIFALPTLSIEQVDASLYGSSIDLQAQTEDGIRTNVDTGSIKWEVHPAFGASVVKDSGDAKKAKLNISQFGMYEVYFLANSAQLKSAFGQQRASITIDMRDDDGDLMADRWEEENGLNPLDGSEGSEDKDNDGYSNLLEYQQGTGANDATDYPDVPQDMGDNDKPVFVSGTSASINENTSIAYTINAEDASPITYSISGGNAALFDVNATTGVVTFITPPDYESGQTSYTFTAKARDSEGNELTQEVTINILDVDETIPDVTPPVISILGSNPVNVIVGTSYTDAGATAIDDIDGDVAADVVRNTVDTDVLGSYEVTYSATDAAGNQVNATRKVNVVEDNTANTLPIADAGEDQNVTVGEVVNLLGSNSTDNDGYIVSFDWSENGTSIYDQADGGVDNLPVGEHTITLTVVDDKGAKDEDNITVIVEPEVSVSPLVNKVIQWEEDVNSTYVEGMTYKHRNMLALYEDTSCRLVDLNRDIEKQNEDKKTLYNNTNKIYTPDTALESVTSCTWSSSSDLLTLSFYDGSKITNIPLVGGTLNVGDVMDSECDTPDECKITKVDDITTLEKGAISNHVLEIFLEDGTVSTFNFRADNSFTVYSEGNSTAQFDGNWTMNDSYINILNSDGSIVLRALNSIYRTVDLIDFTYVKGYISDIQILAEQKSTSKLKKTGQTKSYDEAGNEVIDDSIKDDGYYQAGITPSYTRDNVKQTVTDHVTGLEWQDDAAAGSVTKPWVTQTNYDAGNYFDTSGDTAATYCATLPLDGGGWRLPTRAELQGIVDYGGTAPAINPAFESVASDGYWSSTTCAGTTDVAWLVNFNYGDQYGHYKYHRYYVRCVRAGQ